LSAVLRRAGVGAAEIGADDKETSMCVQKEKNPNSPLLTVASRFFRGNRAGFLGFHVPRSPIRCSFPCPYTRLVTRVQSHKKQQFFEILNFFGTGISRCGVTAAMVISVRTTFSMRFIINTLKAQLPITRTLNRGPWGALQPHREKAPRRVVT
jgi:hypothetical protein